MKNCSNCNCLTVSQILFPVIKPSKKNPLDTLPVYCYRCLPHKKDKANYYAGIGSRNTPDNIQAEITKIAEALSEQNFVLRSGHADGADMAFERGAKYAEIFLPYKNFNGATHDNSIYFSLPNLNKDYVKACSILVEDIHPNFEALTYSTLPLHTRNIFQIQGKDSYSSLVTFVVYYAEPSTAEKDSLPRGGTRTAVAFARQLGISTYNLYYPDVLSKVKEKLNIK